MVARRTRNRAKSRRDFRRRARLPEQVGDRLSHTSRRRRRHSFPPFCVCAFLLRASAGAADSRKRTSEPAQNNVRCCCSRRRGKTTQLRARSRKPLFPSPSLHVAPATFVYFDRSSLPPTQHPRALCDRFAGCCFIFRSVNNRARVVGACSERADDDEVLATAACYRETRRVGRGGEITPNRTGARRHRVTCQPARARGDELLLFPR